MLRGGAPPLSSPPPPELPPAWSSQNDRRASRQSARDPPLARQSRYKLRASPRRLRISRCASRKQTRLFGRSEIARQLSRRSPRIERRASRASLREIAATSITDALALADGAAVMPSMALALPDAGDKIVAANRAAATDRAALGGRWNKFERIIQSLPLLQSHPIAQARKSGLRRTVEGAWQASLNATLNLPKAR